MSMLTRFNIYEKYFVEIMNLLKTNHFNDDQRQTLNYVKILLNEIKFIIELIVIDKSSLILNVLQSFLHIFFQCFRQTFAKC
jgi:hypothetical protein